MRLISVKLSSKLKKKQPQYINKSKFCQNVKCYTPPHIPRLHLDLRRFYRFPSSLRRLTILVNVTCQLRPNPTRSNSGCHYLHSIKEQNIKQGPSS